VWAGLGSIYSTVRSRSTCRLSKTIIEKRTLVQFRKGTLP